MPRNRFRIREILASVGVLAAVTLQADSSSAQVASKLPEMERLNLQTKDGVQLNCAYYPGGFVRQAPKNEGAKPTFTPKPGKEVVPVILLHGFDGQSGDYDFLAFYLQGFGHAVLVPDLRGHGSSKTRMRPGGQLEDLDSARLRRDGFKAMVFDVEAVKQFLLQENNSGKLNIEMLCVVGAEMGSIVAANWTMLDWSRQQLAFMKQGRDVKAMALLSPMQSFKGMSPNDAFKNPFVQRALSIMIIVGNQDRKGVADAKAIHKRLVRFHPTPDKKDVLEKQDLFFIEKNTSLRGVTLVHPKAPLDVPLEIARFIHLRLVNKKDELAWKERKNPLAAESE